MKLETALDEYGLLLRRRRSEERLSLALSALREYLLDYAGLSQTSEVSPRDLVSFLLEYYPSREEPDPEVASALLEACAGFVEWLAERGDRALYRFLEVADALRRDLPRAIRAFDCLKEHVERERLTLPVDLEEPETGTEIGEMRSGLDRIARLDEVRYAEAVEDLFTVAAVDEGAVTLDSAGRRALGEGPAGPVLIPPAAAALLRKGDLLRAEIAPSAAGWELLDVSAVVPGGYL